MSFYIVDRCYIEHVLVLFRRYSLPRYGCMRGAREQYIHVLASSGIHTSSGIHANTKFSTRIRIDARTRELLDIFGHFGSAWVCLEFLSIFLVRVALI